MFVCKGTISAKSFHYLKSKTSRAFALSVRSDNPDDWEELPMDTPIKFEIEKDRVWWNNRLFVIPIENFSSYGDIKKQVILRRYSNDDQIAALLNKDTGDEEDEIFYECMQDWRNFAKFFAIEVMKIVEEEKSKLQEFPPVEDTTEEQTSEE